MKATDSAAQIIPQIEVTERNPEAAFREYIQTAQLSAGEWQALFIYALRLKSANRLALELKRVTGERT